LGFRGKSALVVFDGVHANKATQRRIYPASGPR
jgi:hypothetical protein